MRCKHILIVMLIIALLMSMSACKLEESYKEFYFEGIGEAEHQDYFTSDALAFARVSDVIFIPELKSVYDDTYKIYLSAYAQTEPADVTVKELCLVDHNGTLFKWEEGQSFSFEKNDDGIWEGCIDAGTFPMADSGIQDGDKMRLTLRIETADANSTYDISYDILVKGYLSWVAPV